MDDRLYKDQNYVDMIGTYHLAFFAFGLCVVPHEVVQIAAMIVLVVYGFIIYARRRKINRAEVPSELKLSHVNLCITQFWRFIYLFPFVFFAGAWVIGAFGDDTALIELQKYLEENKGKEDWNIVAGYYERSGQDNAQLRLICNLLFIQPLIWYVIFKIFRGYQAFKRDEVVNPKSWGIK